MEKLTTSQVANKIGVSIYTLNRWYKWWETEDINVLNELVKQGMPELPSYQIIGNTKWRYWDIEDIEQIKKFKEYIPHTRNGFMGSLNHKEEK